MRDGSAGVSGVMRGGSAGVCGDVMEEGVGIKAGAAVCTGSPSPEQAQEEAGNN